MVAYKCDRCLSYYDQAADSVQVAAKSASIIYDLCPACMTAFYRWLGEPQATAKAMTKAMFTGEERGQ